MLYDITSLYWIFFKKNWRKQILGTLLIIGLVFRVICKQIRRRQWHPAPVLLPGKIPWKEEPGRLQSMGSLSRTRLSDFLFTFHFHALEKEVATHSSVLAWRIPGMGEPGGLPSMGSHRVGHD